MKSKCNICNCFKQKSHLEKHYEQLHSSEIKSYECDQCDLKFYTFEGRCDHFHPKKRIKKPETNEKCFKCDLCDYAGYKKSQLDDHRIVHTSDKPFLCTFPSCMKVFKRGYTLRNHVNKHHKDNSFICEICDLTFNTITKFEQHKTKCESKDKIKIEMALESIVNPSNYEIQQSSSVYKCPFLECTMIFSTRKDLNRHRRVHKNESLVCNFCFKEFSTIPKIRCHIRRYHNPNNILISGEDAGNEDNENTNVSEEKVYMSENIDVMFDYELESVENMSIDVVN